MDELDRVLLRAHELFVGDLSDESDEELGALLPQLVDAGYVVIDGESPSFVVWHFTPEGVKRGEELGFD